MGKICVLLHRDNKISAAILTLVTACFQPCMPSVVLLCPIHLHPLPSSLHTGERLQRSQICPFHALHSDAKVVRQQTSGVSVPQCSTKREIPSQLQYKLWRAGI